MQNDNAKNNWDAYCNAELLRIVPILKEYEYTLDEAQPHLEGERYLMNAITTTSGRKLILRGKDDSGIQVIIKASREKNGIGEINHERNCRSVLSHIDFARDTFHTPPEVAYIERDGYVISIQKFIAQESSFLERPIENQFMLALSAFKGQEGAHATTYKHRRRIGRTFGIRTSKTYLNTFTSFIENITKKIPNEASLLETLHSAFSELQRGENTIEQYCGFLTHTDFVPHNIRVQGETIYLLDHSSLTFGNKYEGWARFINFMTLYNPPLQKALEQYVRDNRTTEESESLRLMRIYRLGEILWYYVRTLDKSSGNLKALNSERITFWSEVLRFVIARSEVSPEVISGYTTKRDSLRSEDEKRRQIGLH